MLDLRHVDPELPHQLLRARLGESLILRECKSQGKFVGIVSTPSPWPGKRVMLAATRSNPAFGPSEDKAGREMSPSRSCDASKSLHPEDK